VVLIFGSGKIVITGAKQEEQVPEAAIKVRDRLLELDLVHMDDWSTVSEPH
jgi:TATA-box binding protein (TBP) (component of TFIID and TFIIIB)